jgi:uncharacterized protein YecT (DUF1311 family)
MANTIDINYEAHCLERDTKNVQAACDRKAYTEAFDQLLEAFKHLVRLNDAKPDREQSRRLQRANDAFFQARCRVAAKLGSAK